MVCVTGGVDMDSFWDTFQFDCVNISPHKLNYIDLTPSSQQKALHLWKAVLNQNILAYRKRWGQKRTHPCIMGKE